MFQLQLTNKQRKVHFHNENQNIQIPEKWEDWVCQTKILSGGNEIDFKPYDYQVKIAELMQDFSCIFLKSRQCGLSSVVSSVLVHQALKNKGFSALVFSTTQDASSLLAAQAQYTLNYCGIERQTDSQLNIVIKNGGKLRYLNSNPNSSRGHSSISSIMWDESGFCENLSMIRDAAYPCMSLVGKAKREYFVSTPNLPSGLYYELCNSGNPESLNNITDKIINGIYPPFHWFIDENGFAKIFVWWKAHPVYRQDENFLIDKHNQGISWEKINREYNFSFQEGEQQYFSTLSIEACIVNGIKEERGNEASIYCAGLDTQNRGSDFCSLQIFKLKNNHFYLVASYRQNKHTFDFHLANILYLLAKFPNCVLGVEQNASGKIYYEQITAQRSYITAELINVGENNKGAMCERIKAMIEVGKIHFEKNEPLKAELETFRKVGSQYRAAIGSHDDTVSSLAVLLEAANRQSLLGGF